MTTTAQTLIRQSRALSGLTQRRLAALAGVAQPRIAEVERGVHDARSETVARLVRCAGAQLAVLPAGAPTVAATADELAHREQLPDDEFVLRTFIELADRLRSVDEALRVALTVTPPRTGVHRWDTGLAALVDWVLEGGTVRPTWIDEPNLSCIDQPWVLTPFADPEVLADETPQPFRRRGVLVASSEFASV